MNDLSLEFKSKLQKLFLEKKFSTLEFELECLGNIENLPSDIKYLYAISKSLNSKSKKNDFELAVNLITDIYLKNKKNLEPLYNLIVVSLRAEKYKKTIEILNEALKDNPKDEKIIGGLAKFNYVLANMDESYKFYRLLFETNPEQILSRQTFLTLHNYHSNISQKEYLLECEKYCKIIEKDINIEFDYKKNNSHKIKISFFSNDLRKHSVSYFLKSLLKNLDKNQFEITAFSNLDILHNDDTTLELKKAFDYWYDVNNYKDLDLINFIRKKNIDIIIDLNGYTLGNRLNIFANRVAPIQMLWLGYCNSTGLKNMDFLISDKNCIKKNEEHLYTEKIIYLKNIWNTMYLPENLPDIEGLPYNTDKVFTFGSFNNFQKISSKTILIWSKILNNTNSRILLKNSIMDNEEINLNLKEKFLKNKVREDKVCILNFKENNSEHLSLYNQIDLALDTFPYNGVTTTFESLLMGVPVLSLKGFNFNSRCGESINRNLNLENFIAENEEDYYLKALNNYNNKEYLSDLRKTLRKRVMLSPLLNDKEFNKTFSENLKIIWKDFLVSKSN